jgi:flagellar basal body-associated protein FliL
MANDTPPPAPVPDAQEAAADAPAPAARKLPVRLLAIVGVAALVLGGAGWFTVPRWLGTGAPAAAGEKKTIAVPVKATVPLGALVVNLPGEGKRYLRVATSVGVASAKDVKAVEEARAQLLDLLITVLTGSDPATLASEDGRTGLKEALLARIHEDLKLERVGRVYFTEYVIQ